MKKENKFIKFAIPAIAIMMSIALAMLCVTFIWNAATSEEFNIVRQALGAFVILLIVVIFYIYLFVCAYSWFMDNIKRDWYHYYILSVRHPNKLLRSAYQNFRYSSGDDYRLRYVLLFRLRNINDVKKRKDKEIKRYIKRINGYGGF